MRIVSLIVAALIFACAPFAASAAEWTSFRNVDPMTDKATVHIMSPPAVVNGGDIDARIGWRCDGHDAVFVFDYLNVGNDELLSNGERRSRQRLRLDGEPAETFRFYQSRGSYYALRPMNPGVGVKRKILDGNYETLKLAVSYYRLGRVVFEYDIVGAKAANEKACRD